MLRTLAVGVLVLGVVVGWAAPVVTLYSGGFGYVLETRSVLLAPEGSFTLTDLPHTMIVDSVLVSGLAVTRIVPVPRAVPAVENLVGSVVTVFADGERFQGRLLAVSPHVALSTPEGLVFLPSYDRIVAPLPPNPAAGEGLWLVVHYRDTTPGLHTVGLRYIAQGLSWTASYAATLGEGTLHLQGMATFANETGVEFRGATVSLVAGDVYRPTARAFALPAPSPLAVFAEVMDVAAVFEYHRYAFPSPVDLTQGVALAPMVSGEVPYTRAYRFAGGPVEVRIRFTNTLTPLPAGEVRVYDQDTFIGAGAIAHTPVGTAVDLAVGAAFDLTGERVQEDRQRLADGFYRDTYRVTLRSAKDAPTEVEVVESLSGTWTITYATLPYERLDAQRILFRVPVPASGTAEVRYAVEWRY